MQRFTTEVSSYTFTRRQDSTGYTCPSRTLPAPKSLIQSTIPHSVHHPIHLRRPTRLIYAYPNTPSTAPSTPHPTPQRTKHPPIGLQSHLSATLINRPREVRMCPGYNVSRVKVTHIPATDADRTFIIISFQFPGPRWIYPCMSQVREVLFAPMRNSNQGLHGARC